MSLHIEVHFLVPWEGVSSVRRDQAAVERAVRIFGGATLWPVSTALAGAWRAPDGTVEVDSMRPLVVAIDGLGDLALCVAFARELARLYEEQCVYMSALGISEIVWASKENACASGTDDYCPTEGGKDTDA